VVLAPQSIRIYRFLRWKRLRQNASDNNDNETGGHAGRAWTFNYKGKTVDIITEPIPTGNSNGRYGGHLDPFPLPRLNDRCPFARF